MAYDHDTDLTNGMARAGSVAADGMHPVTGRKKKVQFANAWGPNTQSNYNGPSAWTGGGSGKFNPRAYLR